MDESRKRKNKTAAIVELLQTDKERSHLVNIAVIPETNEYRLTVNPDPDYGKEWVEDFNLVVGDIDGLIKFFQDIKKQLKDK